MNLSTLKTALAERFFGDVLQARVTQAVTREVARATQALPISYLQDPTMAGFRRLTGSGQEQAALRDLPLPTHERMQELAYFLYLANPMAQWLLNIQVAYLAGDGVNVVAKDPDTQIILQAWWTDPVNNWPLKLEKKVRELAMYGEQCWPAFTAPGTGRVRLGYLDPCLIQDVILDPDNAEQPIGIVTKKSVGAYAMPERRYRVILPIMEEELMPPAQRIRQAFTDGECFYFAINSVSNGSRGISDLLAKADWLDGYEQFMFSRIERAELMNRIIFDLELTGFTQEQIETFKKTFALPKPGGTHFHNEKVKLEPKTPKLEAADAAVDARLFKHQALAGYPEHWYGGGGDVNRATAGEMDEPTFKLLSLRQQYWKAIITQVARYQIRQAKAAGTLTQAAEDAFDVVFPQMVRADLSQIGTTLASVAQAVGTMLMQQTVSKVEARQLFAVVARGLGVALQEVDTDGLADMIAQDNLNNAGQDYLSPAARRLAQDERSVAQAETLASIHELSQRLQTLETTRQADAAAEAQIAALTGQLAELRQAHAEAVETLTAEIRRPRIRRTTIERDARGLISAQQTTEVQSDGA